MVSRITASIVAREVSRLLKTRSATGRELRCKLSEGDQRNISYSIIPPPTNDDIDDYIESIMLNIRMLQDHVRFKENCFVLPVARNGESAVADFDGVSVRVTFDYQIATDKKIGIIEIGTE